MQIFAIDQGSDRKILLHSIENVVQLQADELQTCVQALETVEAIVRDARKLKNILSSLELSTARYRRLRAEERIPCIVDNWHWYSDWPSGRLFQLFLLPTPDFRFIVDDVSRRDFAKNKFPERNIPQAFLKLLRQRQAGLLLKKMNVDEETRPGAGERNAGETTTPPPSSSNKLKNQASILEPTALEDADVMHAMLGDNDV